MGELWQNEGLTKVNTFLFDLERKKEEDEDKRVAELQRIQMLASEMVLNPEGFNKLRDSNIWCRTKHENTIMNNFRISMKGYSPQRQVQKTVLSFVTNQEQRKFLKLDFHTNAVDEYISKSNFWKKETVKVKPQNQDEYIKIVFATNKQMACTIFEYMKKIVITTNSSFDNHLNAIEGRELFTDWVVDTEVVESDYKPKIETPVKHVDVLDILSTIKEFNE